MLGDPVMKQFLCDILDQKPIPSESSIDSIWAFHYLSAIAFYYAYSFMLKDGTPKSSKLGMAYVSDFYLPPATILHLIRVSGAGHHFELQQIADALKSKQARSAAKGKHSKNNVVKRKILIEYLRIPEPRNKTSIAADLAKRVLNGEFGEHSLGAGKVNLNDQETTIFSTIYKWVAGKSDEELKQEIEKLLNKK